MLEPLRDLSSQALTERRPQVASIGDEPNTSLDLNWVWTALVKRWWILVVALLAVLAPTGAYLLFAPTLYRARAVIQVSPESAKALPYRDLMGPLGGGGQNYEVYMKTYDGILRSRELRSRIQDRLKAAAGSFTVSDLDKDLSEELQIQRLEGSELVTLSYVATDPNLAAAAANAWAEEFISFDFERKQQVSERATEFLREQLQALKQQVEEAEGAVLEYARNKGILDLDDSHENVIRQRFVQLSEELAKTEKHYLEQESGHHSLENVSFETLPESLKNPAITELEAQVFETEQQLLRLQAQFDNKWPAVIQKQKELALVNEQLKRAKVEAVGRTFRESRM
jgi:uncharacterized protein involved in exopolysaccharide biosynthesis